MTASSSGDHIVNAEDPGQPMPSSMASTGAIWTMRAAGIRVPLLYVVPCGYGHAAIHRAALGWCPVLRVVMWSRG